MTLLHFFRSLVRWALRRTALTGAFAFALALALALTLGPGQAAAAEVEFLPVEQAFDLRLEPASATDLRLRVQVAPGYHLYRDRFAFSLQGANGVSLERPRWPQATLVHDANFDEDMAVYTGLLVADMALNGLPMDHTARMLDVTVTSQGCADAGLCYPPRQQRWKVFTEGPRVLRVTAWDEGSETAPARSQPTEATDANRITDALRSGSLWRVIGVFFAAGLLLSFTPCVLPMVPILSSIIVGQGSVSRRKGLGLSLAYSLGMAVVYTALGVAAGLAGEGLAGALQTPWVLGLFAALLVGLALSMFGLYELQLPNALQTRVANLTGKLGGGHAFSVFVMGGLSALIVGPCVAAPLAGALVFISQTRDVVLGGLALFSLATGMSVPLILVGVSAGTLLPRAGAWMDGVKRVFGFALLALAIWMVASVLPASVVMMLTAAWLLLLAGWAGAFSRLGADANGWQRTRASAAALVMLLGAAELAGALVGATDPLRPLAPFASRDVPASGGVAGNDAGVAFHKVHSLAELEAVLQQPGAPVMLDIYADWCVACKEMEHLTFRDPAVRAELSNLRLLQADVTANNADDVALMKRFGLFGPPGIVFFDREGHEQAAQRVVGFVDKATFASVLQRVRS